MRRKTHGNQPGTFKRHDENSHDIPHQYYKNIDVLEAHSILLATCARTDPDAYGEGRYATPRTRKHFRTNIRHSYLRKIPHRPPNSRLLVHMRVKRHEVRVVTEAPLRQ